MKLVFCMWLGINRSNKFIQSLQVDVVRRPQIDSKQQVRMNLAIKLIRINLGTKLTFRMWLGIHKYMYLIQFIQTDDVRHTWAFQK